MDTHHEEGDNEAKAEKYETMTQNFAMEVYHAGDGQRQDYVEVWSDYPYGGHIVKAAKHRGGCAIGIGLSAGYDLELDVTKRSVRRRLE